MMTFKRSILISFVLLVVGGCATMPTGPSVEVLPAPGKPFDVFQGEDNTCRQWAKQSIGTSPQQVANQNTAAGAVVGTAVGAGLGAAIGSTSGHAGAGALIGGVSGLLVGTSAGAQSGQMSAREAQRRYDNAYVQCMYSYGNQVPGYHPTVASAPPQPGEVGPPPPDLDLEEAPQFVYSPELGMYVAGGVPYDIVYTGAGYFYFYGGRWYRGPHYYGPWFLATGPDFPPALLRFRIDQIRHYRNEEFRRYEYDRAHYDRRRMYRPENRGPRREREHREEHR